MENFTGLAYSGNVVLTVNETWTEPCHWQYCLQPGRYCFNSGNVKVTNAKAASPTTWLPSSRGTPCALQASSTAPASNQNATTTDEADGTDNGGSTPGFGAGIGVGVAIGLVTAGAMAAAWLPLRKSRRRAGNGVLGDPPGVSSPDYHNELQDTAKPVEMQSTRDQNVAELHSEARQHGAYEL